MQHTDTKKRQGAIAIIQARCSSRRLPNKVMLPLSGKPLIWHIAERARSCRLIDRVVVATSNEQSDDQLAEYCGENGIDTFRGSLTDVMSRYLDILEQYDYKYFARITGDCPLVHPYFIDRQIEVLRKHTADVVSIGRKCPLLEGQGVHSTSSLRLAARNSCNADDREHVGARYFCEQAALFKTVKLKVPSSLAEEDLRITVDEKDDYEAMRKVYDELYQGAPIDLADAVSLLKSRKDIASINQFVRHSPINQELGAKRLLVDIDAVAEEPW